mmetsp:Transcript_27187/g.87392  ORF Transcript_27187/g.87392 Transcript_27187/m.87392 type:complete len:224 (-) Transcript_27187:1718-2389(-)
MWPGRQQPRSPLGLAVSGCWCTSGVCCAGCHGARGRPPPPRPQPPKRPAERRGSSVHFWVEAVYRTMNQNRCSRSSPACAAAASAAGSGASSLGMGISPSPPWNACRRGGDSGGSCARATRRAHHGPGGACSSSAREAFAQSKEPPRLCERGAWLGWWWTDGSASLRTCLRKRASAALAASDLRSSAPAYSHVLLSGGQCFHLTRYCTSPVSPSRCSMIRSGS